ncbi:bifunctional [glutamate--ammonia ligase]-adenylyl-L-tyrosine phosphorylase/[glutamate--ammonia-ligase] adenylyltransferase [Pusillimonas sp. CC-YST705]|uniref:Bifunctional glutamine synthetase adenylyltransferase/adenylyl-removing enzyme n=1 Tax=Mesopusillimonas faecipullorum TaxID=2755040 RepID=A0ABS8CCF4_9BURK|nr:bifunctional [glutamate--ammonia ligase]-adenylyl-L-tyrosine phosphorylase/[glutamate--ammonia-ligase] adenylyltransferase [Mesopusillimonas faecipullorum]MCB5363279.1 bifunctional [glutamate--ammonia ligase]-adenylyl-L-tyrosine phosphorylase/[glutamate--ammonia-ligase] adenylyltransferase [Mesopusillimonas faecipullorum]
MFDCPAFSAACEWSGVLQRKTNTDPAFAQWLIAAVEHPVTPERIALWQEELQQSCATLSADAAIRRTLRRLRQRVFYTLMVRDIGGMAPFTEVVQATTYLADLAVGLAYRHTMEDLSQTYGKPIDPDTGLPQEMLVLGMGKLGGKELNVSSDIDLIMLYGNEGETTGRRRISHHEFYGRLTQRMMPLLSEPDADGQVFRTDLRLRPDGDGGPLAWSLEALEHYLISQGREWERYAWLKARHLPGRAFEDSQPVQQWEDVENLRRPFVYRKYFDFDALAALRALRERIREDWQRKVLTRTGIEATHNVKLGDGGIREIEFIVQLNQLIRGGRQPSLQQRGLLKALHKQKAAGVLPAEVADGLEQAYLFLRRTEHMLQYREDQQTHLLPTQSEQWEALARAMGLSRQTFEDSLARHRQFVHQVFRNAFRLAGMGEDEESGSQSRSTEADLGSDTPLEELLRQHLGDQAAAMSERIKVMLDGQRVRKLSNNSRARLDALLPAAVEAAAATGNPAQTLSRLLELIERIAQRSAYLALLTEYPNTLARMARLMDASPWASQYLTQYPLLLDSLIEWRSLMAPLDLAAQAEQLRADLEACVLPDGSPDVEQQMNLMRDVQHQVSFQLLAQDLDGSLSVEALADQLSALADLFLETTLERVWPPIRARHPEAPEKPKFAVIAYGKLGGKELGYASDLDLVFVYDDPNPEAPDYYTKLARRATSWLTTLTSSGRLYEIDLRLRPDGDAGLLAVSLEGFEQYQRTQAWPWEHQALTRARFVAGDAALGERFETLRREILLLPRDLSALRAEVIQMRAKIAAGHPNRSKLFDIKHDPGGMVDVEFITQFLVLAHAAAHPVLLDNLGNIALLRLAAGDGLIPTDLAKRVSDVYRVYRKAQHALRLQGASMARAEPSQFEQERAAVRQLWEHVLG